MGFLISLVRSFGRLVGPRQEIKACVYVIFESSWSLHNQLYYTKVELCRCQGV